MFEANAGHSRGYCAPSRRPRETEHPLSTRDKLLAVLLEIIT